MQIQFPQEVGLRDGRRVIIRRFSEHDVDALFAFFQGLPEAMKRLAWDRIEARSTVENWARAMENDEVSSLLALDGTKVVGDATLHYRDHGPLRRVGRVKWLIEPEYYGSGIGTALLTNFIQIARLNGLRRLTCMLVEGQEEEAVKTLKRMGFEQYVIPDYGTDPDGEQVNMLKMVLAL